MKKNKNSHTLLMEMSDASHNILKNNLKLICHRNKHFFKIYSIGYSIHTLIFEQKHNYQMTDAQDFYSHMCAVANQK